MSFFFFFLFLTDGGLVSYSILSPHLDALNVILREAWGEPTKSSVQVEIQ